MQSEFDKGVEHYRNSGKVQGKSGFSCEFLNGYHFEERISRCGFHYEEWFISGNYKRL